MDGINQVIMSKVLFDGGLNLEEFISHKSQIEWLLCLNEISRRKRKVKKLRPDLWLFYF